MKATSTGKWLLNAFLNKEVDAQDQGLATVVDAIQYYEDHMESEWDRDASSEKIAIELGLLEE